MPDTMITTADVGQLAPAKKPRPKSLKAMLRDYRQTYKEFGAKLAALDEAALGREAFKAGEQAAAAPYHAAIDAMIEAPIVSLEDVSTKLRFLLEVVDDGDAGIDRDSWEGQIIGNILRDSEKPHAGSSLRELRQQCKSAFRASMAADAAAERKWFAVRREHHPSVPEGLMLESLPNANGETRQRAARKEELEQLVADGELSAEELPRLTRSLEEWEAACQAVDIEHGVPVLEAAREVAEERWLELDEQFIKAPVQTLDDILVKLEFLTKMKDMTEDPSGKDPDQIVFGLVRDLKRMTGAKR